MHAELPLWPPRRRRRQTDMLWLERLEEVRFAPFQDAFPDSPPAPLDKAVDQFNTACSGTATRLWKTSGWSRLILCGTSTRAF